MIGETQQGALRRFLVDRYDFLVRALTRNLGSRDAAKEVLHETYLRLEKERDLAEVRDPAGYLLRTALNLANNTHVRDRRRGLEYSEDALMAARDEQPDPHRVAEARGEWQALMTALEALPERRREIFLAVWIDETPQRDLAERYGVTVRMVQYELHHALAHCVAALTNES